MARTKTPPKTLEELTDERADLLLEEARLQTLYHQLQEEQTVDNVTRATFARSLPRKPVMEDHTEAHLEKLLQDNTTKTLGGVLDQVHPVQARLADIRQEMSGILYQQHQDQTTDLRAQLKAKYGEIGEACDRVDAHLLDRELRVHMDRLNDLFREAAHVAGRIRQLKGNIGGGLPLMPPQAALKRRTMHIEQIAFDELDKQGKGWGKYNPAKPTMREALNLPPTK